MVVKQPLWGCFLLDMCYNIGNNREPVVISYTNTIMSLIKTYLFHSEEQEPENLWESYLEYINTPEVREVFEQLSLPLHLTEEEL